MRTPVRDPADDDPTDDDLAERRCRPRVLPGDGIVVGVLWCWWG
ncbi:MULTISPECIES: hypothetical protein [Streptomyces]|uniref:Integral membrane protein n=1 Tax=Streptomyces caniscabiei TaxID=2746961 RepID=A0ABU4MM48_9ACTN|nr:MULTISPECIES: hypothetical protein [Streptomyces]MDX2947775.1 hypothetical protein [Streptomyces caniscabiei]MDX2957068.1 hypothetical protein [Streptomyces caniscabiei]MDX2989462.1 hypothetical protein [Streptomyces caniscabiei]MDX3014468.1 hypothetical protein [Streptomyces caniscabiei]MDX3037534.1 hypothetical protein [Streptomyces caniscabiei]